MLHACNFIINQDQLESMLHGKLSIPKVSVPT